MDGACAWEGSQVDWGRWQGRIGTTRGSRLFGVSSASAAVALLFSPSPKAAEADVALEVERASTEVNGGRRHSAEQRGRAGERHQLVRICLRLDCVAVLDI